MKHTWHRWIVVIVYCGLIFFLSELPKPPRVFRLRILSYDKLLHLVEYGLLSIAFAWALYRKGSKLRVITVALIAGLFSAAYGITDELHQSLVPGRHATVYDVLADALGGGIGVALWLLVSRRRPRAGRP